MMDETDHRAYRSIQTSFGAGEELREVVDAHWATLLKPFVMALCALGIGVILVTLFPFHSTATNAVATVVVAAGAGYFVAKFLSWRHEFMVISTKRVLLQRGVFSRSTREIPLAKISDVSCTQSLLGRMLGFGMMRIDSENIHGSEILPCIAHPVEVRALLSELTLSPPVPPAQPQIPDPPRGMPYSSEGGGHTGNLVEELERLSKLFADGFITLEEFEYSKAKLLGR